MELFNLQINMPTNSQNIIERKPWLFFGTALAILTFIRIIPEILIGKYPIGYDASISYIENIYNYNYSFIDSIKDFNLYYYILFRFKTFSIDPILLIKSSGVILFALICVLFLLISQQISRQFWKLKNTTLLLGLLIFGFQLTTLRFSWDLYRNELGLVFFMFSIFTWLKFRDLQTVTDRLAKQSYKPLYLILATISFILIFATHQLVSLIALGFLLLSGIYFISNKYLPEKLKRYSFVLPIFILILLFTWTYIPNSFLNQICVNKNIWEIIPFGNPNPQINLLRDLFNLIFMPFIFPLVVISLAIKRNSYIWLYISLITLITASSFLHLSGGFIYWDRWIIFLGAPLVLTTLPLLDYLDRRYLSKFSLIKAIILIYIPFFILISYKSFDFIIPGRDLLQTSKNKELFNIFPYSIYNNAYTPNWTYLKAQKNIDQCLTALNTKHQDFDPIIMPSTYLGIMYQFPQILPYIMFGADPLTQTQTNSYYIFDYSYLYNTNSSLKIHQFPEIDSTCPIFHN